MPSPSPGPPEGRDAMTLANQAWFTTTHWTVVLTAKEGATQAASEALENLCRTYWRPVYSYMRRQGHQMSEAQDLTQEFFAHLLKQDFLSHWQHQKGRFRSFLLKFAQNFLSDQRDKANALKRGGGRIPISLDEARAEEGAWLEPKETMDPQKLFEKRWAHTVLEEAASQLGKEYEVEGKAELFRQLKEFQPGVRGGRSYADAAAELGMSETAFKSAMHRMRQRYNRSLRLIVANTVSSPGDVDDEIKYLTQVLAGG